MLPALLLNYFGQGALLLSDPEAAEQPFFLLAPDWALLPLVVLATAAAIIASQALISGAFSLTRQAIQLGYCPRLDIEHTSSHEIGQVYVPQVNWALMVCTIAIVIGFGSSTRAGRRLRHRGHADDGDHRRAAVRRRAPNAGTGRWPSRSLVTGIFLTIDLAFFGANVLKILHGGWLPLVIGAVLFTLMTTWKTGRRIVAERLTARAVPLEHVPGARSPRRPPARVPGTAVFMTAQPRGTPPALAHNLRYNKVLHEHVVILMVTTQPVPHVTDEERSSYDPHRPRRLRRRSCATDSWRIPTCPRRCARAGEQGLAIGRGDVTYFLGRETLIVTTTPGMAMWRERLFVLMARNAGRATAFFRLPPERVVELGVQVEIVAGRDEEVAPRRPESRSTTAIAADLVSSGIAAPAARCKDVATTNATRSRSLPTRRPLRGLAGRRRGRRARRRSSATLLLQLLLPAAGRHVSPSPIRRTGSRCSPSWSSASSPATCRRRPARRRRRRSIAATS